MVTLGKLFSIVAFSFVVLFSANNASATQFNCTDHREFIKSVSSDVISLLENSELTEEQKEEALEKRFAELVDVKWIGRFVLGRNYRKLTKEEKATYHDAYEKYIIATYVPKFKEFNGEEIEVLGSRELKQKDSYLVQTNLIRPKSEDVKLTYRISKRGVCFQIQDIIAEGVSMLNTQRQDFASVISRKGYDSLLKLLKDKYEAETKVASELE